jgi:hypothetical protein
MNQDIRCKHHKPAKVGQAFAVIFLQQDLILFQHACTQITRTQEIHIAVKIGGWLVGL